LLPNTQVVKNIEQHLVSVFKDELTTTFNMKQKSNPGYATSVVDMMFVSADVKVADHECLQVDVSDHLPLIVTLDV
jgi:endonuclease/exonuclease/phosphatase family metal-dependent hydrolase